MTPGAPGSEQRKTPAAPEKGLSKSHVSSRNTRPDVPKRERKKVPGAHKKGQNKKPV